MSRAQCKICLNTHSVNICAFLYGLQQVLWQCIRTVCLRCALDDPSGRPCRGAPSQCVCNNAEANPSQNSAESVDCSLSKSRLMLNQAQTCLLPPWKPCSQTPSDVTATCHSCHIKNKHMMPRIRTYDWCCSRGSTNLDISNTTD